MQSRILSWVIVLVGVMLIGGAFVPNRSLTVYAAPLRAVTPTAEPPTPTATTPPTNTPVATNTPLPGVSPTLTPVVPTATAIPVPATTTPAPTRQPDSGRPDIAITKTADRPSAQIGDRVTFTLTLTNIGDAAADDVVATDTLPDGFDFVQATASRGTVSVNGRIVTVTIGTVQPGETITITISTIVNATAQPGQARNIAIITTTTSGDNPNNNQSTVTVDIVASTPAATAAVPTSAPSAPPQVLPPTGGSQDNSALFFLLGAGLLVLGSIVGFWRPGTRRS